MNGSSTLFSLLLFFLTGSIHMGTPDSPSGGERIHHVSSGDTLDSIGEDYGIPWQAIAHRNRIKNPHGLRIGQELIIPKARPKKRPSSKGGLFFGGDSFLWPVKGQISSYYGMRNGRLHEGIDIRAPRGTKIVAAQSGKVTFAGWMRGYGKTIVVQHDNYQTLYAHMAFIRVKKNQWIEKGRPIGGVGATGRASGNHLHFEIRKDKKAVNPMSFYQVSH